MSINPMGKLILLIPTTTVKNNTKNSEIDVSDKHPVVSVGLLKK